MRSKRLPGLPVLSIVSGNQLGRVRRPIINADQRKVTALVISGARLGGRKILPMEAIHALGSHAVTVTQEEALQSPKSDGPTPSPNQRSVKIIGSPVVTIGGALIGTVHDYEIGQDGIIKRLFLSQSLWKALAGGELQIPGELIVAIGEDSVIVADEVKSFTPVQNKPQSKKREQPSSKPE